MQMYIRFYWVEVGLVAKHCKPADCAMSEEWEQVPRGLWRSWSNATGKKGGQHDCINSCMGVCVIPVRQHRVCASSYGWVFPATLPSALSLVLEGITCGALLS